MTNQPHPVSTAFEIIIQKFSDQTLPKSQQEIYECVLDQHLNQGGCPELLKEWHVEGTLRFLNHFDLADNPEPCDWSIKSVDEMCDRLCVLVPNYNIRNDHQRLTVSIAFEIIIHHFNGQPLPHSPYTTVLRIHQERDGLQEHALTENRFKRMLFYLKRFGFAVGNLHIKSVEQMCQQLRDLGDNRNSGGY